MSFELVHTNKMSRSNF